MKKVSILLTAVLILAFATPSAHAFKSSNNPLQSSTVKSISFYLWSSGLDARQENLAVSQESTQNSEQKLVQLPEELNVPLKRYFGPQQN